LAFDNQRSDRVSGPDAVRLPRGADGGRLRPRIRSLLGRPSVRHRRDGLLHRLRARAHRLDGQERHSLEDLRDSPRGLCEVRGRHERGERSGYTGRPADAAGAAGHQFSPSKCRQARRHRRGRADCQFHPGDRDLRGLQLLQRADGPGAGDRAGDAWQRGRGGRLPAPGCDPLHRRHPDRDLRR